MNDVTIPATGSQIRIIAEGTVTAYDPGCDAVQLDHGECWWPYSDGDNAVRYETIAEPPTLREKVAKALREHYDPLASVTADAVLAVIADEMAKRPWGWGVTSSVQRADDLAWLRGEQS